MLFLFVSIVPEHIEDLELKYPLFDQLIWILGKLKRTDEQIRRFELGGNGKMKEFLEKYELHNSSLLIKYKTKAANNYRINLDLLVEGKNLIKEPNFEEGREMMDKTKNEKETYFSFGSDDLVKKNRFDSNGVFDQNLKKGKDAVFKIGNFLTNSMTSLVKKTSNLVTKKKNEEELSDDKEEKMENKGKFSISELSNKLGNGIWSLGSKTKNLAHSTTNFIKKTTNGLIRENKKEIEKDVGKEVENKIKYDEYFTSDMNEEDCSENIVEEKESKKEYPVYQKEKVHHYQNFEKDDDDVHFI